jgi:hypothetical protein
MNTNADRQKQIESIKEQLRQMHKRSEIRLKKISEQLEEDRRRYQQELSDFQRLYGEQI